LHLRQAKLDTAFYYLDMAANFYAEIGKPCENYAFVINNLGNIYLSQGNYEKAERAYQKSAAMRLDVYGPHYPHLGEPFNNLGCVCAIKRRFVESEMYYKLALFVRSNYYGPEWYDLVYSLNGLGELYVGQQRYFEADSLFRRALNISEKEFDSTHFMISWCKRNLGILAGCRGWFSRAKAHFHEALQIDVKIYGADNPLLADDYKYLAMIYAASADYKLSLNYYNKSLTAKHDLVKYVFPSASMDQKMKYVTEYQLIDHSLLTLAINSGSGKVIKAALEMVLRGKAFVIDALSKERQIAFDSPDESIQALNEHYNEIRGELSTLILFGPTPLNAENYPDSVRRLVALSDSLETELSLGCAAARDPGKAAKVTSTDVARTLPENGVLWDFLYYQPADFREICGKPDEVKPGRYLAFKLDQGGDISLFDLGEAAGIDSLILLTRSMLYDIGTGRDSFSMQKSEKNLKQVTTRLHKLIFEPLADGLADNSEILIAPDGKLNLIPFEILPCANGKYAVENYSISYLSSGRDLTRFGGERTSSGWAMLVADPDFNLSKNSQAASSRLRSTTDCQNMTFSPLPLTREEMDSIANILQRMSEFEVRKYYGDMALEEIFKRLEQSPAIMNIATHAFFCEEENGIYKNPLLLAGIVLAGANRTGRHNGNGDDGILTAFEISGLNFTNTELAVLSACETGLGEVKNGEGVFGLRRAFQLAGVKAVLMSLWQVPDKETSKLMIAFYRNWLGGMSKKEAFRQSVLEVIRVQREETGCAHPFFWGAFVLTGNPR